MQAAVYVNWSRLVADCPYPLCTAAAEAQPGQQQAVCDNCGRPADLVWPAGLPEILAALERRPVPATRNWFPADHPLAVAGGLPHGQTVADLDAETEAHLAAEQAPPERPPLEAMLADYGFTLAGDGTTLRRL
ncbi:hypothetical protein ACIODS_12120 [Micromonospora chalcea]|uniref:hypothetical protein n=1 Tax=Micromonospora chalcea TaxID=1874 RepID=UPI0038266422